MAASVVPITSSNADFNVMDFVPISEHGLFRRLVGESSPISVTVSRSLPPTKEFHREKDAFRSCRNPTDAWRPFYSYHIRSGWRPHQPKLHPAHDVQAVRELRRR